MLKMMSSKNFNNDYRTYGDFSNMFSFSCSKSGKTWGQNYYDTPSRGRFRF